MAITLTQGQVYIIASADAGAVRTGSVVVKGWRWVGATTAGHAMSITDAAGKVFAAAAIQVANDERESRIGFVSKNGITVALQSGTLYLYV